ncbi:hypothetical protein ACU8V7_04250 [Zobellia nedashkovskayae]
MGRKTYEFGYRFGLQPGQPAYAHMENFIFSKTLQIEALSNQVHIEQVSIARIKEIAAKSQTDVYLCGGGAICRMASGQWIN